MKNQFLLLPMCLVAMAASVAQALWNYCWLWCKFSFPDFSFLIAQADFNAFELNAISTLRVSPTVCCVLYYWGREQPYTWRRAYSDACLVLATCFYLPVMFLHVYKRCQMMYFTHFVEPYQCIGLEQLQFDVLTTICRSGVLGIDNF